MHKRRLIGLLGAMLLLTGGAAVGLGIAVWRAPGPAVLAPEASGAEAITFLAVGRQGYGNDAARRVARAMEDIAALTPPHFLVFGGDNFFPDGVTSIDDPQWRTKFEDLYDGPHLRGTPVFAVLGNHDLRGNAQAQLDYAAQRVGSARWRMEGRWYSRDFGRVGERVLVRIVFLDMLPMMERPDEQIAFLREAMAAPGEPVWKIVVGHNPLRSLTEQPTALTRVMHDLLPIARELGVDVAISSNDWFQQLLDVPGEPLHVGTSGGGRMFEPVPPRQSGGEYTRAQPGFARVRLDADTLTVEMFDAAGDMDFTATRERGE